MPELRLADIQAGLGLSTSRFGKLRRAVREEVEREGLATKTLATNSMRLSLQELVGRMIARFDRILPADNDDFNKEAILKLVHIEKANVARHVETKRKANQDIITHSNANPPEPIPSRVVQAPPPPTLTPMTSSKRDLKRHGQKPLQNRSVAALNPPSLERCSQKSPEPDPRFSIEVSVSQAQRLVENRIAEPFVIVRAEATLNDPTVLSLNCFLTDKTAPAVVGDKLLQACYHTLCNVLREEGFLGTEAEEKLWGWVASGPFSGWWRIRSSYSLRSCLTAQRLITPDGHYEYVVNHGMLSSLPGKNLFLIHRRRKAKQVLR